MVARHDGDPRGDGKMTDEFQDLHVVVTGGSGGLGASVGAMLLERSAWCHVPYKCDAGELGYLKQERMRLYGDIDLTDESAVVSFYARLSAIWASIHLLGGDRPG